jgi:hypothetical protein
MVAAPAIVKAESLMKVIAPKQNVIKTNNNLCVGVYEDFYIQEPKPYKMYFPDHTETHKDFLQKHLFFNEDYLKAQGLEWVQEGDAFAIYRDHKRTQALIRFQYIER